MGSNVWNFLVALSLMVAGCGVGGSGSGSFAAGWQGSDIHLVDGTWIGTETACGFSGYHDAAESRRMECQTIVDRTMAELPSDLRDTVRTALLAVLPTTFVTASGESRSASLTAGILSRRAVVLDLVDGSRRVIGLWCYLPYSGAGSFEASDATCRITPLDHWRDGNAPPSLPPGWTQG